MSSRHSVLPPHSERTDRDTGPLDTHTRAREFKLAAAVHQQARGHAANPPLSSSSCAHTVLTHTSLLMTYTRRKLNDKHSQTSSRDNLQRSRSSSSRCVGNHPKTCPSAIKTNRLTALTIKTICDDITNNIISGDNDYVTGCTISDIKIIKSRHWSHLE